MPDATPPSARQRLIDWANDQDAWVRAIVHEVLATGQELPDDAIANFYAVLLAEKQLSKDPMPAVPTLTLGTGAAESGDALHLIRLGDVQNVNALAAGQAIEFNPHLTVLFGENASGKSGYVRILKKLAAVRSEEDVLPNIRPGGTTGGPSAKVKYALGAEEKEVAWSGEKGLAPFTRMSVFDSRAVTLHVDDALSYIYTPRDLALFSATHQAVEGTRERLDAARRATDAGSNPFLQGFVRDTTIYPKLATLGPQTDLAELRSCATITDEEIQSVETLRVHVAALQPQAAEARLQIARGDKTLFGSVLNAAETLRDFDWQGYRDNLDAARKAADRHADATQRAFAGVDIPAALSEPWSAFIQAGEAYLQHLGIAEYPHEAERCLYCRQPLARDAVDLLRKYRDYCNNTLRQELDQARAAVEVASRPLATLALGSLESELVRRLATLEGQGEPPPLLKNARDLIRLAVPLQEQLKRGETPAESAALSLSKTVAEAAHDAVAKADELVATLSAEATERQRALEDATTRLRELEARLRLRDIFPALEKHVSGLKWGAAAATVLGVFPGLLRGLTGAAKAASEQLLNQDFERLFTVECGALRAPPVKLEFPGREGQPKRKKTVSRHALSAVLSEGEQKVIALADFLAEAALPKAVGPIVFDDPVNSLDYKRLEYVVDRIVELSKSRQVVVFTHNIWFAVELLSRCDKDCTYYDVSCTEDTAGVVEKGTHPRWDTVKKTSGTINNLIAEATKASGEVRQALVEKGYSWIRAWCEVVVEQELLAGVTQRYQPHVRMTGLRNIKAGKLEAAVAVILPIFEKACRATEAHSQPLETLGVRPKLDDLKADWDALQKARDGYQG